MGSHDKSKRSVVFGVGILSVSLLAIMVGGSLFVHPAAAAYSGPPVNYVVYIMMENKNYADIIGNPSAPYLNQLASTYGLATNYHELDQYGSLPEYIGAVSGNTYDTVWSRCNTPPSQCSGWPSGGVKDPIVTDRLDAAGLSWKGYMEDMPSNCDSQNSGSYMVIHNPFPYFSSVINNPSECAKVVPAGSGDSALLADLGSVSTAPRFMWLTPNNCNDMWGCSTSVGDSYLSSLVPQILNSQVFKTQPAALFITWDEGSTAGQIPAIWAGPAVKHAYTSGTTFNDYSVLKTLEMVWNLSPLTSNDSSASDMTGFFTATTGTTLQASFTHSPSSPQAGQSVSFTGTATGGTPPYTYSWAFGDGASGSGDPVSHTYTSPGSYTATLTVSDSAGGSAASSGTITVLGAGDFAIGANPGSLTITAGTSASSTITIASNGFSGTVSLSATVSPAGPATSLNPSSVNLSPGGSSSSQLTVTTSTLTPPGLYTVTVKGTSGSLSHSTTVSVSVVAAGPADFSIRSSPSSLSIRQGRSGTSTITVASLNGFSGTVSLRATVSPSGPGLSLSRTSVTLSSGGSGSAVLTIRTGLLPAGRYTITVTGTSGQISHSTTIVLTIRHR